MNKEGIGNKDLFCIDGGSIIIHRENLDKYLKKYGYRSEDDFIDSMWFSYGIYAEVI